MADELDPGCGPVLSTDHSQVSEVKVMKGVVSFAEICALLHPHFNIQSHKFCKGNSGLLFT